MVTQMAQRKRHDLPDTATATPARLAGDEALAFPSPVHALLGEVEAWLQPQQRPEIGLNFAHAREDPDKKFPGWVRVCIFTVPTIVFWAGIAVVVRSVI